MSQDNLHNLLHSLCTHLPTDFEPYGERSRETDWGPDCSCGCLHFLTLEGSLGADWGVCANPASPRAGMLTFEHQGCRFYEDDPELETEFERRLEEHTRNPSPVIERILPIKAARDTSLNETVRREDEND